MTSKSGIAVRTLLLGAVLLPALAAWDAKHAPVILHDGAMAPMLPAWTQSFIAKGTAQHPTVIEEVRYGGERMFHIMPGNEAADGGSEHILLDQDGGRICVFGGLAGHVTAGSCDLAKISYVRKLYPAEP